MKKLLYTILLSLGTFLFTACTDYINVDKYFYDQVLSLIHISEPTRPY